MELFSSQNAFLTPKPAERMANKVCSDQVAPIYKSNLIGVSSTCSELFLEFRTPFRILRIFTIEDFAGVITLDQSFEKCILP